LPKRIEAIEVTELPDGTKLVWAQLSKEKSCKKVLLAVGESFITLGLILALFVGYKAVLQDSVIADKQIAAAAEFVKQHKFRYPSQVTRQAQIFGRMYVPRFGTKWTRLIAEGTRWHPVLNEIGIGHYVGTTMPGEVGNFAVAAHRGGFGGAFKEIHRLTTGDKVFVETRNFWYVYKYLQTKIVNPNETTVINAVPPELDGAVAGSRYMTMTSCTPIYVNTQRIIVWLELDRVIPIKNGPPQELNLGGN
jgi:sortase A